MFPGDLDALAVAREQSHYAMSTDPHRMTLELRLQPGLLAAQVALAERLPAATPSRLEVLTGAKSWAGITNSLRRASSDMWRARFPEPTLVEICHTKPSHRVVAEHRLAEATLPLVVEAFERIDARNARIAGLPR